MKYYKTLKKYKSSNFEFDLNTMTSKSYDWWLIVKQIGNRLVVNEFNYSPTTLKHQSKARRVLSEHSFKVHHYIHCPKGLQELNSAIEYYNTKIETLKEEINKPRTWVSKNEYRQREILYYKGKLEEVRELILIEKGCKGELDRILNRYKYE